VNVEAAMRAKGGRKTPMEAELELQGHVICCSGR